MQSIVKSKFKGIFNKSRLTTLSGLTTVILEAISKIPRMCKPEVLEGGFVLNMASRT
jgi:hypothetical protein